MFVFCVYSRLRLRALKPRLACARSVNLGMEQGAVRGTEERTVAPGPERTIVLQQRVLVDVSFRAQFQEEIQQAYLLRRSA